MIHSGLTMRSRAILGAGVAMLVLAGGCGTLAVWSAPEKTKSATRTPAAERADALFWRTLHGGAYDQIPQSLTALKAAYLADPNDSVTAAHVGFMHIWRLAERARIASGRAPRSPTMPCSPASTSRRRSASIPVRRAISASTPRS
jgi:hypothetical protein